MAPPRNAHAKPRRFMIGTLDERPHKGPCADANWRDSRRDRLKNKVALISGGARGQGAAEAKLFINEGAKVVIGDVLDGDARKLSDDLNRAAGARVTVAIHLDVTRAADWRAAVDACDREFGGLDVLVNNAGILNTKGIAETSEEEWDAIINVNQKGVWLGMKVAAPAMKKRGSGSS